MSEEAWRPNIHPNLHFVTGSSSSSKSAMATKPQPGLFPSQTPRAMESGGTGETHGTRRKTAPRENRAQEGSAPCLAGDLAEDPAPRGLQSALAAHGKLPGTWVAQRGAGGKGFSIPISALFWGCSKALQACSPKVLSPYKPVMLGNISGNQMPPVSALTNGARTARISEQAASSPWDGKAAAPFRAKIPPQTLARSLPPRQKIT